MRRGRRTWLEGQRWNHLGKDGGVWQSGETGTLGWSFDGKREVWSELLLLAMENLGSWSYFLNYIFGRCRKESTSNLALWSPVLKLYPVSWFIYYKWRELLNIVFLHMWFNVMAQCRWRNFKLRTTMRWGNIVLTFLMRMGEAILMLREGHILCTLLKQGWNQDSWGISYQGTYYYFSSSSEMLTQAFDHLVFSNSWKWNKLFYTIWKDHLDLMIIWGIVFLKDIQFISLDLCWRLECDENSFTDRILVSFTETSYYHDILFYSSCFDYWHMCISKLCQSDYLLWSSTKLLSFPAVYEQLHAQLSTWIS